MERKIKGHIKTIRRVIVLMVIAVISFVILSMTFSAVIFNILFGRMESISPLELSYSEIDSGQYPRAAVSFNSNGTRLRGYLYGLDNGCNNGVVIIANGIRSGADSHLPEIMYFVDNSWCVFSYDGTGTRESEGSGAKGLSQSKIDLESAIEYIGNNTSTKELPIVVYGHSVGGYAAVTAIENEPKLAAVVCISGFESPVRTMHYYAKQRVGILADIELPFMQLQNSLIFGEYADVSAVNVINSTETPIIIVEGSEDDVITSEIGIGRHRGEITNPNVYFITIDTPYRNRHSTAWLSPDAAEYYIKMSSNLDNNSDVYIDKQLANKLDEDFMEKILSFYSAAVAKEN